MKKFLSIEGWNPEFYKGGYEVGAYVAFKMPQSNILRVGIAIEPSEGKSAPAIKCLTNNKIYYPYTQDILLFNDNCTAKILISKIIEVE